MIQFALGFRFYVKSKLDKLISKRFLSNIEINVRNACFIFTWIFDSTNFRKFEEYNLINNLFDTFPLVVQIYCSTVIYVSVIYTKVKIKKQLKS